MKKGYEIYWKFSHPTESFCCNKRLVPFFELFTSSIGEELNLDKYSKEVVKAYLIGGRIWDNKEIRDRIAGKFVKKVNEAAEKKDPKTRDFIRQTYTQIPDRVPLTHNFFVIYFGSPEIMDFCKVSLVKINGDSVKYNKLFYDKEEGKYNYEFVDVRDIRSPYYSLDEGYYLSHRGTIFYKPTGEEVNNYLKDLDKVLVEINNEIKFKM